MSIVLNISQDLCGIRLGFNDHLMKDHDPKNAYLKELFAKIAPTPSCEPAKQYWWTQITEDPEFKQFKENWKKLANVSEREDEMSRLKASQASWQLSPKKSLPYHALFGTVYSAPGDFSMWMPGVALLAAYMAEKKNVQGLYVCETLESLSRKINEINLNPENQRCALVVGVFPSGWKKEYPEHFDPNFPQHKITVCVEKKNGKLSIAVLDAFPDPEANNREINPAHLKPALINKPSLWKGYMQDDNFNTQELAFRAILLGCRNLKGKVRLLHSQVFREKSYGCELFAIQDAIDFLKNPTFFNAVICEKKLVSINPKYAIESIKRLPVEHMRGTQSFNLIKDFQKNGGDLNENIPGKQKSLGEYIRKCTLLSNTPNGKRKMQNHYMTKKTFKAIRFLELCYKKFSVKQIEAIIKETLI